MSCLLLLLSSCEIRRFQRGLFVAGRRESNLLTLATSYYLLLGDSYVLVFYLENEEHGIQKKMNRVFFPEGRM